MGPNPGTVPPASTPAGGTPAPIVEYDAPDRCQAESHAMLCMLAAGHDGLHYDDIDDMSWKDGEPGA